MAAVFFYHVRIAQEKLNDETKRELETSIRTQRTGVGSGVGEKESRSGFEDSRMFGK